MRGGAGRPAAIGDYAIIGDCRSAALVSRAGSVDWLCWPRFDSPSLLAALLDPDAGHFAIAPTGPAAVRRRYLDDSNVLETRFETATGVVTVTDFMPVASEAERRRRLMPDHELVRLIDCERGEVEVALDFAPRPDFGRPPRLRDAGALGLYVEHGRGVAILRTDLPLRLLDGGADARERLRAGSRRVASLGYADDWPAVLSPLGLPSRESLARSLAWWRAWAARLEYDGPARELVLRSALTIKLLGFAPSGAVVAAPTTSLPERLGGDLNWDYRFCWLRDASLTVRALYGLGYAEEATAFVDWLLHSTRITRPELKILYDVYGRLPRRERTLDGWRGYADSRPVRVGNAADEQLQLDVYGEVIDAAAQLARAGARLGRDTQRMLCDFGRYVCRHWHRPDEGIWEPRSGRARHTHSHLLCWTAVDRLLELHGRGLLCHAPVDELGATRAAIRHAIETRAWRPTLDSYAATLDGDDVDATLLLLAWYGFEDAASPRMRATFRRVRDRLGAGDALLYRYRGGESPGEGAFGICSFWGAEYLALGGGTLEEAERTFARLTAYGNDVGLFAEEIDPADGAALGNFPQAFTHVGLINAAITLARRQRAEAAAASEAGR